jgi:hypothetical protein
MYSRAVLTAQQAHASAKFRLQKTVTDDLTYLTLHGVVDEGFEGRKMADAIRTKKVVMNLRDVRRFASWGMAEWTDFVKTNAARDVYLVECSTQALSQFNLVTGLSGHAKIVSFYVPYRCASCGEESETLLVAPIDRSTLLSLAEHEQPCATCGRAARVDKYLASMCQQMAEKPPFDIDDEVVGFLRSQFKYNVTPDLGRFRAHRLATKQYTYLRLSGNLSTMPSEIIAKASEGATVVDLTSTNPLDHFAITAWRSYVESALRTVPSIQLLECPPGFLEAAVLPEDLGKLKVRTFVLAYQCAACNISMTRSIDVAQSLEHLVEGTIPSTRCDNCKSVLEASVTPELAMLLRRLPAREHDVALDKFLDKARSEPPDRLEDATILRLAPIEKAQAGVPRALYIAIGLMVLVAAGVAVIAFGLFRKERQQVAQVDPNAQVIAPKPQPTFQRPDWILSDLPSSAFCHDMINRLMCVGVSSYRPTRNEAVVDANDAALDELVNTLGLKISEPFFKDKILPRYSDTRTKALATLQAMDVDRTTKEYAAANDVVRAARKRVVDILQASGGAAVPAQRSDWYWEEYAVEKGTGTEVLVFVRYDVSLDAIKALVDRYSTPVTVSGTTAMTAFPALAWQAPDFAGGAVLTKVGKPLSDAHVAPGDVVMSINDQPTVDAAAFEKLMTEWKTGAAKVKRLPAAGPADTLDVKH